MALLTRAGVDKLLKRIMESGGLTPDMTNDIQRLRDDYDEREGILKNYGEVYDGEDLDEYEYKANTQVVEEGDNFKEKYESLQKDYIERFFGGVAEEVEEVKEDQKEDVESDGEETSFNDLFKEREG